MAQLKQKGCTPDTLSSYRRNLRFFWNALDHKQLALETVSQWRDTLVAKGYHTSTVNHRLSSVNGLLAYLGLWEYRAAPYTVSKAPDHPELTRVEYLRLLAAARNQGRKQVYLLVKVFGCTGITVQELSSITVEAVQQGQLLLEKRPVYLPTCLCRELLEYAGEKGVAQGSIFVTRTGKLLSRTNVTAAIQRLSQPARVAPEKCNPRCLRKLYLETRKGFEKEVNALIEQAYQNMIEQEQLAVGWTKK